MKKTTTVKKTPVKKRQPVLNPEEKEMTQYGISRVKMDDQFQFGKYRYNSLEHALAEAKREQS